MAQNDSVNVKWKYADGDGTENTRRFMLPRATGYSVIMEKINEVMPGFLGTPYWKDEDGDLVEVSNDEEFAYAASLPSNQKLFRLFTFKNSKVAEISVGSRAVVDMARGSDIAVPAERSSVGETTEIFPKTKEQLSKSNEVAEGESMTEDQISQRIQAAVLAALAEQMATKKETSPDSSTECGGAPGADHEGYSELKRDQNGAGGATHPNAEEQCPPKTGELGMDFVKELDAQVQKLIAQFGADANSSITDNRQRMKQELGKNELFATRV